MKIPKKWLIAGIVVILLIVGGVFWKRHMAAQAKMEAEEALRYTVQRGDIAVQVKVSAVASLVDEQNLSFGQEGKIQVVNVSVGDEVTAGDVLAELDMDDYLNAVQSAELELENANLALQKLMYGDTSVREAQLRSQIADLNGSIRVEEEQSRILEQQLANAMTQKQDALKQLEDDISVAKKALEVAKQGLEVDIASTTEQTEKSLTSREQTLATIKSSLRTSLLDIERVIEQVDMIFGASSQFSSQTESYIDKLSTKDTSRRRATQTLIRQSYSLLEVYRGKVNSLTTQSSDQEIYQLADALYQETELLLTMCATAQDALDMSSPNTSISESQLTSFYSGVSSARANAVALRKELQGLASSVNSLLEEETQTGQLATSVEELKIAYEQQEVALKKLEDQRKSLTDDISTLQSDNANQLDRQRVKLSGLRDQLSVTQQELRDVQDGADQVDIDQQENLVRQAELRLERVKDQQEDYQIIADFDGRVRSVDIVVGEQYELENREFIVVENPDLIELELQVSQIDIVKIKQGDEVEVTFDAYPHTPIQTEISSRDVNPQSNGRGGVYYKATIVLEKQELEILAGMTALVTVTTDKAEDIVTIPSLALIREGENAFVSKWNGESYEKHPVEIGISNNFHVGVVSGLEEGEVIRASVLDEEAFAEMGIDDTSNSPFGG